MLTRLYILNYAIIEKLDIQFGAGLNVITGETGAGKSILMGALNLILGERADISALSSGQNKCIVEGYFKIKKFKELSDFFIANDLDEDEEIVLRREISSNGKSRSFINDTPVNLNQLKKLSVFLVDLHQQFDTRELGDSNFQMLILDSLADNNKLLYDFREKYNSLKEIQRELKQLNEAQAAAEKERDYNSFLFDELNDLNLSADELEALDSELNILNNSEEIKKQLSVASFTLKDSDEPVVQTIKSL
ncbi:MAG: AAA family ATPase, partial [Ferruginibacter sp.]